MEPLLTGTQVRHLVLACNLNPNKLGYLLSLSAYDLKCALNPTHRREFTPEELEICTQYFQQLRDKIDQALHAPG